MTSRNQEKYEVLHAHTSRLMNSTAPYIQRLLSMEENEKTYGAQDYLFYHPCMYQSIFCRLLLCILRVHDC